MAKEEGQQQNGTQAKPTPEAAAVKAAADTAAKVAADKAADAKLLDGNGNPKSEEVLAADTTTKTDKEDTEKQNALKSGVETKAKQSEDLVRAAGIDPSELITRVDKDTGELSVSDKAKLISTHGEAIADLIEGSVQKMVADTKKYSTAKDKAVFDQVAKEFKGVTKQGGEETWKELAGWIKKNMDVGTRKEYNKMLTAGGLQATLAVKEMVNAFKKDNDMTIPAQLVEGDSDASVSTGGFITRSEYMKQLDVLQKAGHDYDSSPEIAILNKKRMKSINSGK